MTSTMMSWTNSNNLTPFNHQQELSSRARYIQNDNHQWRPGMTEISRLILAERNYKNERDTVSERESCQVREKLKEQTDGHVIPVPHGQHHLFTNQTDQEDNIITNRYFQSRKDCIQTGNSNQPFVESDSIESFLEFARYLDNVNPICPPEALDTIDKLISILGM